MRTLVALLAVAGAAAGLLAPPAFAVGGPTISSIDFSANPASAGQPVTLKVTVRGTVLSPVGFAQLFDGGSLLGPPLVLTPDFDDADPFCSHCVPTDHSSATLTRRFSTGTHVITVAYSGGVGDLSSVGGPSTLTVNAATSSTSVSSSADPSIHGQAVTFTASVSSSGDAPSGTVQFRIDGADYGSVQSLDGGGHASVIASDLGVGSHDVGAAFTSDNPNVQSSTGVLSIGIVDLPQIVNPADTTTTVVASQNPSEFGDAVTFTASVAAVPPGGGAPTGTVQFEDDGVALGTPRPVDGAGDAVLTTSGLTVGAHSISADYSSDSQNFKSSAGSVDQTVGRARTILVYAGAQTGDFHDPAVLSAELIRARNGAPVAGKPIDFTLASETCSATTATNGGAGCSVTPTEAAATYAVAAAFAGDADYEPASVSTPFAVTREETTTTYTGPTVILQGQPVTLSGQILEDGVIPIAGRTLTLTLGTGTSAQSCITGGTDLSGNAQCTLATVNVPLGPAVAARRVRRRPVLPAVDRRIQDGNRLRLPFTRHVRPRRHDGGRRRLLESDLLGSELVAPQRAQRWGRARLVQGLCRLHRNDAARLRRNVVDQAWQRGVAGERASGLHGHGRILVDPQVGRRDLRRHRRHRRRGNCDRILDRPGSPRVRSDRRHVLPLSLRAHGDLTPGPRRRSRPNAVLLDAGLLRDLRGHVELPLGSTPVRATAGGSGPRRSAHLGTCDRTEPGVCLTDGPSGL